MVALSEIRELELVFKGRGVDEGLAKLRALAGAEDAVTQSSERFERSTASLGRAQEKLNRTLDENYSNVVQLKRATEDLEALRARDMITTERHAFLLGKANERYGQVGKGAKLASHELTNMGAQLTDMSVQLAGGANAALVFAQQLPQMTQGLGDRGLKGAIGAVGQGILAFATNPLNLATLGVVGLTAAAGYAWSAFSSGERAVESIDDVFQRHEATLKRVEGAYAGITKGIGGVASSPAQISAALYADADSARAARLSAGKELADKLGTTMSGERGETFEAINRAYFKITEAASKAREQAQGGKVDFNALHEAVSRLYMANPNDAGIAALWKDIDKATEKGRALQDQMQRIDALREKMDKAGGPTMYRASLATDTLMTGLPMVGASDPFKERTDRAADAVARYRVETEGLIGTPLDQALAREKNSFAELQKQIEGTRGSLSTLNAARGSYDQRIAAIRTRYGDDGSRLSTGPSAYDRLMDRSQDRLRDMQSEIATLGMGKGAVAAYRIEQELMAAATEKGAKATRDQKIAIAAMAGDIGSTVDRLSYARLQADPAADRSEPFACAGYDRSMEITL